MASVVGQYYNAWPTTTSFSGSNNQKVSIYFTYISSGGTTQTFPHNLSMMGIGG
jgi:hypothetical protein